MRVIMKVYVLTWMYLLQFHNKKFNIDCLVEEICLEDEHIEHMLLRCPALSSVRNQCLAELKLCLQHNLGLHIWPENFRDRNVIIQSLVDCRKLAPSIILDK